MKAPYGKRRSELTNGRLGMEFEMPDQSEYPVHPGRPAAFRYPGVLRQLSDSDPEPGCPRRSEFRIRKRLCRLAYLRSGALDAPDRSMASHQRREGEQHPAAAGRQDHGRHGSRQLLHRELWEVASGRRSNQAQGIRPLGTHGRRVYRAYYSDPEYLSIFSDYHHFLVDNGFVPDQVYDRLGVYSDEDVQDSAGRR